MALAAAGLGSQMTQARLGYLLWSVLFYGPPLVGVLAYTVQEETATPSSGCLAARSQHLRRQW